MSHLSNNDASMTSSPTSTNRSVLLWRMGHGVNALVAIALMLIVIVLVNAIAARLPWRYQLASQSRHILSDKTTSMMRGITGKVHIIALLDSDSRLYDDVLALLREYSMEAESIPTLDLRLEVVAPQRDIARTRELAQEFGIEASDQIIVSANEKTRFIDIQGLSQYELELTDSGVSRRMIGFFGEQALSSAMLSVSEPTVPVVYFLTGHGERDIEDTSPQGGYSSIARVIARDNFEVKRWAPGAHATVPDDCDVLVIPGPDRRIASSLQQQIEHFLTQRHGRVMIMLDPGRESGLEGLLRNWGVDPVEGVVGGMTFTGRELVVSNYGDHPVTRHMENITTMFYRPRPLKPMDLRGAVGSEDRVRVAFLAGTGAEGWIENNLNRSPSGMDPEHDRRGPIAVALAVERGAVGIGTELPPTRLVVVGDSRFVANAAVNSGVGGNISFMMASLNWLVERDHMLDIAARVPSVLHLGMPRAQWNRLFYGMVFGVPLLLAFPGLWLARCRR